MSIYIYVNMKHSVEFEHCCRYTVNIPLVARDSTISRFMNVALRWGKNIEAETYHLGLRMQVNPERDESRARGANKL